MEEVTRDKMITVPVSQAEMDMAKSEADKLGMPVSSLVRLLLKSFANGVEFKKKLAEAKNKERADV